MKQKADYFLSFVIDKNEKAASSIAALLPPPSAAGPNQRPAQSAALSVAPPSLPAVNVEHAADGDSETVDQGRPEDPKQFFRPSDQRAASRGASRSRQSSRAGSVAQEGEAETSSARARRDTPGGLACPCYLVSADVLSAGRRSLSRAHSRQPASVGPDDAEGSDGGAGQDRGSESGAASGPSSLFRGQPQSVSGSLAAAPNGHQAQAGPGPARSGSPDPLQRADPVRHAASPRARLACNLEQVPALTRTPWSMTALQPVSLANPTLMWGDKAKAKELLANVPVPGWLAPPEVEDEEYSQLEARYWGLMGRDEAYLAGLPAVPTMCAARLPPKRKIPSYKKRRLSVPNGEPKMPNGHALMDREPTPALSPERRPVDLGGIMDHTAETLDMTRTYAYKIADWQRAETEGGLLPGPALMKREEKAIQAAAKQARVDKRRLRREREKRARGRRAEGGEMNEAQAAAEMRRAAGTLLAHAGFEGLSAVHVSRDAD